MNDEIKPDEEFILPQDLSAMAKTFFVQTEKPLQRKEGWFIKKGSTVTGVKVIAADALSIAQQAGNDKAVNVALIGLMAKYSGFDTELIREAIRISVPAKFLEVNLKAYDLGLQYAE